MKLILSILVVLLAKGNPGPTAERWVILKSSKLTIEGRSNINSFRCDIAEYLRSDTIYLFRDDQSTNPIPVRGGLSIEIKGFDCHQKYITNDLRKTLRADAQPNLRIDLLNIGRYNGNADNIKGWVNISLAGVTKKTEIDYRVRSGDPYTLQLDGARTLRFSDFGLKPPHKLAGLIKVEEELQVSFHLVLQLVRDDRTVIIQNKKSVP